jgi:hypothetical protein
MVAMQSSLLVRHLAAVLKKMEARELALGLSLTPLPSMSLFACPLAMAEASSSSQPPSLHPPLPIPAAPPAPHLAPLHRASSFSLLCHWVPHRRGSRSPRHPAAGARGQPPMGRCEPWPAIMQAWPTTLPPLLARPRRHRPSAAGNWLASFSAPIEEDEGHMLKIETLCRVHFAKVPERKSLHIWA